MQHRNLLRKDNLQFGYSFRNDILNDDNINYRRSLYLNNQSLVNYTYRRVRRNLLMVLLIDQTTDYSCE